MSTAPQKKSDAAEAYLHELESLKNEWWWFLILGIGLVVLGMVAITIPLAVSLAGAVFFGVLLLMGGVAQVVSSFWTGQWQGVLVHLLSGILYLVAGSLIVGNPVEGLAVITLLLAAFFMIGGIFKIVVAMQVRFHNWGWPLLSGVINLLLGILIWRQWPESSLIVIGLFLGLEMLFNGLTWIMLAFNVKAIDRADA
jgi:uncharacterized membrane protein HdeD (DUF308 family)